MRRTVAPADKSQWCTVLFLIHRILFSGSWKKCIIHKKLEKIDKGAKKTDYYRRKSENRKKA